MNELDRLRGLVERQGLRAESAVRGIEDLLHDLARTSIFLARESRADEERVSQWMRARGFDSGDDGWLRPKYAGEIEPEPSWLWTEGHAREAAARDAVHRHRTIGAHLASVLDRVPAVRRCVHVAPAGPLLVHPPCDPAQLACRALADHPLVRTLYASSNAESVRWCTPILSAEDAEVTLGAGISVRGANGEDLGLWIAEVLLADLFADFSVADEGRGEENLFVVDGNGEFLFDESFLEASEQRRGEPLRGSLAGLGGEHWQLDLDDMRARGAGQIELLAEDGKRELLVFRKVEGTDWLALAEIRRSALLAVCNRRIEAALRSAGSGDFSQRVDLHGLGGRMQSLADAYNEMAENLQREERIRRVAEEAVAEGERKLEAIAEASPVGIFRVDRDGQITYHNRRAAEIAGVHFGEFRSEVWEQAIHPDDRGRVLAAWRKATLSHTSFRCEHRYLHASGAVAWVLAEARPERDGKDHFLGMVGTTTDVSELKRSESERRAGETRLSTVLDSIGDAVIATDAEGRITLMNPPAEDLCGWSERDARGRRVVEVVRFTSGRDAATDLVRPAIDEARKLAPPDAREIVDRRGRTRRVERSAAPLHDDHDHVVGCVLCLRDVTERVAWTERMARARRLEAVGQLATGIAHDFRNVLTGIGGEAELVALALAEDSPHQERLASIVEAVDRADGLARELFAYAPSADGDVLPLDPVRVLAEIEERLRPLLPKGIEFTTEILGDPPRFIGDPAQLANALLNVALNARDAVGTDGTIRMSARSETLDARAARERGLSAGDYAVITVTDDGEGMSAETRDHLFEPYYTTKGARGSGLGLAAVESCVGRHGGAVQVESEEGRGSAFHLWLPATRERAVTLTPAVRPEVVRGQGRILLVDDEEIVRNFAARSLRDMGYDVVACGDGARAVELYDAGGEGFDLVLLDLVMPGTSGREVFEELHRIDPEARVLIASGYGDEGVVRELLDRGALGLLEKPFRVHELSQAVARHVRAPLKR